MPTVDVRWLVDAVSMASPLALVVTGVGEQLDEASQELARVAVGSIRSLERGPQRPVGLNDRAIERARDLANLVRHADSHLQMSTADIATDITLHLVANADEVLATHVVSFGTIEGRLEGLNLHGDRRRFFVYEVLTDQRIACDFGHRISVQQIGQALERRVAVEGAIHFRANGQIDHLAADALHVLPGKEQLPSAGDVYGILTR
jgi:hypothetical protein